MSKGYDDKWDRLWGISFLKKAKNKSTILAGADKGLDIKDYYSNYGADVEQAQNYNPIERDNDITIPWRKQKITKYWDNGIVDYIQFIGNSNQKLIYISDEVIRKYINNPIKRGNFPFTRENPWNGYSLEECREIWNTYIEIPKSEVEIWERSGSKGNWKWNML